MKLIGNVLLWVVKFVLLLPFRVLALIGCFVIGVNEIMIKLISNLGAIAIGLFNLLLLVSFVATLALKDYSLMPDFLVFIGGEAIILMLVGLASRVLSVIRDWLFAFAFGRSGDLNLSNI